jgi:hypothetical protein
MASSMESDRASNRPGHEYYEELCALLPLGSLTDLECQQLKTHLAECECCRKECAEYVGLVHKKLSVIAPARTVRMFLRYPFLSKSKLKKHFIDKAVNAGINLSDDVTRPRDLFGWGSRGVRKSLISGPAVPALSAIVMAMLIGSFALIRRENRPSKIAAATYEQNSQVIPFQNQTPSKEPDAVRPQEPSAQRAEQSNQSDGHAVGLDRLREEYNAALARTEELERLLDQAKAAHQTVEAGSQSLTREIEDARRLNSQLLAELQAKERSVAEAKEQLESEQRKAAAGEALAAVYHQQVDDLSERLGAISSKYEKDVGLLAADRDIRELMGARNLHIIDVSDVDGKGRTRHTFGRIFYTEHRSLIFYAFDLENKPDAAHSFQAWGCRQPDPERARNLGIFYTDDKRQNRWVLKYADPSILAEIDAVFVTLEPPGGSPKPTGHKLLYALLGGNRPNHP